MSSPAAGTAGRRRRLAAAFPAIAVLVALAPGCSGDSDPPGPGGPGPGDGGPFTYASTDVPKSIPDGAGGGPVTSYLTVAGAPTSITKVTVNLTVWHACDEDLYISLYSPSGTQVALSNNNGLCQANYNNTTFDDDAPYSVSIAGAPFSGTYQPQWPLSILDGANANGTWQLRVTDMFPGYTGTIQAWSIHVW